MKALRILALAATILLSGVPLRATLTIWVAPTGNDSWAGTHDRPLSTFKGACAQLKAIERAGLGDDVVVCFRGGNYLLGEPVTLSGELSGTAEHSVTFASCPGEHAVFWGGSVITGRWERSDGTLWKINLQSVASGRLYFHQLYREGETLPRARMPKDGFYTVKAVDASRRTLTLNETLPPEWGKLSGVELDTTAWWHFNRQLAASIGTDSVTAVDPIGSDTSSRRIEPGSHSRVWLENAVEFATRPGEWYLDRINGNLFYRASQGEDPNGERFIAPALRELVVLKGSDAVPIVNVHLSGLEFAYTDWELPPYGRLGVQAGDWASDRSRTFSPPGAVRMIRAEGCSVSHCFFHDLGEGAVTVEIGCHRDAIERCEFRRVGTDVIQVGRIPDYTGVAHPLHWDFRDPADSPSDISVADNTIDGAGTEDYGCVGIWVGYANHVRILHNFVRDTPYSGMSIGWRWAPGLTNCHDNEIAWNRVEKVMQETGDGGGIYMVGDQPGSIVHDNYVHDSGRNYWAHGLYADEDSDHMEFTRNYVTSVMNYSIFMNLNGPHQSVHDNNGETGPTDIKETSHYAEALKMTKVIHWAMFSPERIPPDINLYGPRPEAGGK
jgi:hypothetical protein